jgi:hypothetical protein
MHSPKRAQWREYLPIDQDWHDELQSKHFED